MLRQLEPSRAWAHPTARRGSMTWLLQRPCARCASASKCWAPITRRLCKRSKTSPTSDPPPLEQGQGAGGDDARAALGREGSGKEAERACDLATALKYRFAGRMLLARLKRRRPLRPLPATFPQVKSNWKRVKSEEGFRDRRSGVLPMATAQASARACTALQPQPNAQPPPPPPPPTPSAGA